MKGDEYDDKNHNMMMLGYKNPILYFDLYFKLN